MNNMLQCFNRIVATTWSLRAMVVLGTVLADVLFYQQPSGWPAGAFLLFVGLVLAARPAPQPRRTAMFFALSLLVLAAGAVAYCGGALGVWLSLLALIGLVAARMDGNVPHADLWMQAGLRASVRIPVAWLHDRRLLHRRRSASYRAAASIPRATVKWLIPLALTGGFLWLFCMANPVIERGVLRAVDALGEFLIWVRLPDFTRLLFWGLVAVGLWGVWRVRTERKRRATLPPILPVQPVTTPKTAQTSDEAGLVLRCLILFNMLFAVETVVDILYLWSGRTLPEGMTYATYAHRGAYPLVATALLSAFLTLCFFRPGHSTEKHSVIRMLVLAWLAQNVLLTASAACRLHLYVEVYTLTELRVAAFVWIGLVMFGLATLFCRIAKQKDNRWLMDINAMVLLAVLLGCAWWPMNNYIARHNVCYCRDAGGPGPFLDLAYLHNLGPEAIPALRDYARLHANRRAEVTQLADTLTAELHEQLRNPRAWTWRRGYASH